MVVLVLVVIIVIVIKEKVVKEREEMEKFKREMRVVKIFFIVMGIFMFCWVFYFIGMICLLFEECKKSWFDEYFVIIIWFVMLNSGCNFIIYGVMN